MADEERNLKMRVETLMQVLCAAHWTYKVHDPYNRRGGILLVAPSEHGKSMLLKRISEELPGIWRLSDLWNLTIRHLSTWRSSIISERIKTLIIDGLEKVGQQQSQRMKNLESTLKALMKEGFEGWSEGHSLGRKLAVQALVIVGCTEEFYLERQDNEDVTFLRYFLRILFQLDDPDIFLDSLRSWEKIEIEAGIFYDVPLEEVPNLITESESKILRRWLELGEMMDPMPFQLFKKIGTILRWRFNKFKMRDLTMEILEEFSESLRREGARLIFPKGKKEKN